MSEFSITIEVGKSKRLLTAGKYCDRDIVVTAEGGGENGTSGLFAKAEKITWAPTEDASRAEISHSLGEVPDGYVITLLNMPEVNTGEKSIVYSFAFDTAWDINLAGMRAICAMAISGTSLSNATFYGQTQQFCNKNSVIPNVPGSSNVFAAGSEYEILVYKR